MRGNSSLVYEGGGIYRDVRLVATEDLYVPYSGTCIRSKFPDVTDHSRVQIELQAKIHNAGREDREAQMIFKIFENTSDSGHESSQSSQIAAGTKTTINHQLEIAQPKLWSVASPLLYRLESHIQVGGKSKDIYHSQFGLRSIRFDAEKGCFLNGESIKLKGVCNHQDHAGVGTAILRTIDEWRLKQLKAMGCTHSLHKNLRPLLV